MPTYRHKALKLTAKLAVGYIDMYLIREDDNKISRMFGDTILPLEYIIHFGFEEVKEEKQDWIDKVFDCIFTQSACHPHGPRSFRREHLKAHTRSKRNNKHLKSLHSHKN